jgi:hypothetical protein
MSEWLINQQIEAQAKEGKAFHTLMNLLRDKGIDTETRDEVIKIWVNGTEGAGTESRSRALLQQDLSESEYRKSQERVHQAWVIRLKAM